MMFKMRKDWNKKAEGSVLVDYGATVFIVLIILVFFFVLSIENENAVYEITGEQIGIDATTIALVYAQTPVETTKGTITFAEFLALVAEDTSLTEEFVQKTEEYFKTIQRETKVTIILIQNDAAFVIMEPTPGFFERYTGPGWILLSFFSDGEQYSTAGMVTVPLHNPNNFGRIFIQTKIAEN